MKSSTTTVTKVHKNIWSEAYVISSVLRGSTFPRLPFALPPLLDFDLLAVIMNHLEKSKIWRLFLRTNSNYEDWIGESFSFKAFRLLSGALRVRTILPVLWRRIFPFEFDRPSSRSKPSQRRGRN